MDQPWNSFLGSGPEVWLRCVRTEELKKELSRSVKQQQRRPLQQSGSRLVRNLLQPKRRLLLSPQQRNRSQVNILTGAMKRGKMREKEGEEPQISQGKKAKKAAEKSGPEGARDTIRAPFKQPNRQSAPGEPPAKPAEERKTSVAKSWGAKLATAAKKSTFLVCSNILCWRARVRHCSSTASFLSLCAAWFTMCCSFFVVVLLHARGLTHKRMSNISFLWCCVPHRVHKNVNRSN